MAKAYKCDACGGYCDSAKYLTVHDSSKKGDKNPNKYYDVCPRCMAAIAAILEQASGSKGVTDPQEWQKLG